MKVVITGANSFIGLRMQEHFLGAGWQVVSVSRKHGALSKDVDHIALEMSEYSKLGELVGSCDCFVHLAWNGTRGASRMDAAMQRENIEYSLQGVHSMLKAGCGKIVTAGSQAEYGPHAECISEETPCLPNTEYGKAKLQFYREARALCDNAGVKCIEPRFFSLYGPGDYPNTMVISTLHKMIAGEDCPLTQGIQMWDYLHIEDACDALCALCQKEDVPSGVYNFGSGDTRQLKDYITEMAEITHTQSKLLWGAIPYPETGMVSLWPDVSRLKGVLKWEPRMAFSEGVQSILNVMLARR